MSEHDAAPAAVAGGDQRNLLMRIAAALVLAPLAIGAAYAGGWYWTVLATLGAIGLFVEWLAVTYTARNVPVSAAGVVALVLSAPFLAIGNVNAALVVLALGLVAVAFRATEPRIWAVAGFLYAAAAQVAALLVRLDQAKGLSALILVLLVVWATDIGGYFAGRAIGGPKLWPRVSPKKTWAGAIGGFVASLLVAIGFSASDLGKTLPLVILAAMLSVAAQLGDLFESAIKRRFGVKDSGHIIPGHGGVMDRLDGFVAAIVLAAIFGVLRGGADGVGRALMVW
ncbi:MAG TPA: CDP-archaeol synthase [Bradyrhizobium sp.]|nr:CDP-archaeol synthase [Bradyrhizobium sp.]